MIYLRTETMMMLFQMSTRKEQNGNHQALEKDL